MRETTSALLGAAATAGSITGCGLLGTAPEPDSVGVATKLPEDTDNAKSVEQAEEFTSWLGEHGSGSQKDAAARVQRIIGQWDGRTGVAPQGPEPPGGPGSACTVSRADGSSRRPRRAVAG